MKNIPKLYIMIGIPGAGKSTLAKEIAKDNAAVIVSSDSIRKELFDDENNQDNNEQVFNEFHKRIKSNLKNGVSVIADATNLSLKSRRAILQNVLKIECEKNAVVISRDIYEAISANNLRSRVVPEHDIFKHRSRFQIPFYEEGFDNIFIVQVGNNKTVSDLENLIEKTCNYDQKNHHHADTLDQHCLKVTHTFLSMGYSQIAEAAGVLHDIGKLYTQQFDEDGEAHYLCHENVGAYTIICYKDAVCKKYNLTDDEFLDVVFLANYHMRPYQWTTDAAIQKNQKQFGNKFDMLMDFHKCDSELSHEFKKNNDCMEEYLEY